MNTDSLNMRVESLTDNLYSVLTTTNTLLGIIAVVLVVNTILRFVEMRKK